MAELKTEKGKRVPKKKASVKAMQSPRGQRALELRLKLLEKGVRVRSTNYESGSVNLEKDASGLIDMENAIKVATEAGFKVEVSGGYSLKLTEDLKGVKKYKKRAKKAVTETADTANQSAGTTGKRTRKKTKGVSLSKVRISKKSTGGMKNHVTISGAAFMGLIDGVSPNRLAEAVVLFLKKLSPQSRKTFVKKLAQETRVELDGNGGAISKSDLKLLARVKKLGLKLKV